MEALEVRQNIAKATKITSLAQKNRLLPKYFGLMLGLRFEASVYDFYSMLNEDYCGGVWDYYEVSGGAMFMVPSTSATSVTLSNQYNYAEERVSPISAGICVSMMALSNLSISTHDKRLADVFYVLDEYINSSPEEGKIRRILD